MHLHNLEQGMAADEATTIHGEGAIVGPLRDHTSGGSREQDSEQQAWQYG